MPPKPLSPTFRGSLAALALVLAVSAAPLRVAAKTPRPDPSLLIAGFEAVIDERPLLPADVERARAEAALADRGLRYAEAASIWIRYLEAIAARDADRFREAYAGLAGCLESLEALPHPYLETRVLLRLLDLALAFGMDDDVVEFGVRLRSAAVRSADADAEAFALAAVANSFLVALDRPKAEEYLGLARAAASRAVDPSARAFVDLIAEYARGADPSAAQDAAAGAAAAAAARMRLVHGALVADGRRIHPYPFRLAAADLLSRVLLMAGEEDAARSVLRGELEALGASSSFGRARALFALASLEKETGHPENAAELLQEALAIADDVDPPEGAPPLDLPERVALFQVLDELGRYREASAVARSYFEAASSGRAFDVQGRTAEAVRTQAQQDLARRVDAAQRLRIELEKKVALQRTNMVVGAALVVALAALVAILVGSNLQAKRFSARLELLSQTDPLTGVGNRRRFNMVLRRCLDENRRRPRPFAVVILDLDRFKAVNDRYGHVVGDAVLVDRAGRARTLMREGDLLARWGGEEFAMLLLDTGLEGAVAQANRIREAFEDEPVEPAGTVTASFGVAAWREGDDAADLLTRADAALYRAKADGRNCVRLEAVGAEDDA